MLVVRNISPAFLNPDFLYYNEIVPKSWELSTAPISTPGHSVVSYGNGLQVSAVPVGLDDSRIVTRLMFKQTLNGNAIASSVIASTSLSMLGHLDAHEIVALGINSKHFVGSDSKDETGTYLANSLVREGEWRPKELKTTVLEAHITYETPFGEIRLKFEQVTRQTDEIEQFGFTIDTNMHHEGNKFPDAEYLRLSIVNSLTQLSSHEENLVARLEGGRSGTK